MKQSIVLYSVLLGIRICANAGSTQLDEFILGQAISEPRSNLCAVVFTNSYPHSGLVSATNPVSYGFVSTTNISYQIFILKPEYGCRISAHSKNRLPIKKTKTGVRYGEKLDLFKEWKWDEAKLTDKASGSGDLRRPYWGVARCGMPSVRQLPPLKDLFEFQGPGRYWVTVEFQVGACPLKARSTEAYLLRFTPVTFETIVR